MFRRFFRSLIFIGICIPLSLLAQSVQTFSYTNPICRNGGNKFPVKSSNWQGGPNGFYSSQPGLSLNPLTGQINAAASSVGVYTVNYTGGLCACTPTTVVQVVNASTVGVSGNSVCVTPNLPALTLSSVPSSFPSYTWSIGNKHTPTVTVQPVSSGPHTLYVTDLNGCVSFTVFNVILYLPFQPFISASPIVCMGSTVTLIASGANSYTWNTGATSSVLAVSPSVTTTYTVFSKDVRGCIGSRAHTLQVLPSPSFSATDATVCAGLGTTLGVGNVTPSTSSFIWMPGSLKGNTVFVSPSKSTTYTVTGNNGGCTVTKNIAVTVLNTFTPSTGFTYSLPLCAGQSAAIEPDTTGGFTWGGTFATTPGEGYSLGLPLDPLKGTVNTREAKAGTYLVTYSIPTTSLAAEGCTTAASSTAIVSIIDSTKLEITPDVTITEGESVKLTVSGGENFEWTPQAGLSCAACPETMAFPLETTRYCVRGTSNMCYSSACVNVEVICHNNNDFSVPNAFTPNGDGKNDEWCLQGWERCNKGFKVKVFNRWGELVFESDTPGFCWDGTSEGVLLDADVYAYFIKAKFFGEPEIVKGGNVTLLR